MDRSFTYTQQCERQTRAFYRHIYPNHTAYDVANQNQEIVKFTPCGKFLIAITNDSHSVVVYRCIATAITNTNATFSNFFRQEYQLNVTSGTEALCRTFCLFTASGDHLILASATKSAYEGSVPGEYLDDITFIVIRFEDGKVCSKFKFQNDHIYLEHHSGVSLYKDLFTVVGIVSQTITIFKITLAAELVKVATLGPHCNDNDVRVYSVQLKREKLFENSSVPSINGNIPVHSTTATTATTGFVPANRLSYTLPTTTTTTISQQSSTLPVAYVPVIGNSKFITGIKHRILAFLFRKAFHAGNENESVA